MSFAIIFFFICFFPSVRGRGGLVFEFWVWLAVEPGLRIEHIRIFGLPPAAWIRFWGLNRVLGAGFCHVLGLRGRSCHTSPGAKITDRDKVRKSKVVQPESNAIIERRQSTRNWANCEGSTTARADHSLVLQVTVGTPDRHPTHSRKCCSAKRISREGKSHSVVGWD